MDFTGQEPETMGLIADPFLYLLDVVQRVRDKVGDKGEWVWFGHDVFVPRIDVINYL